MAEYFEVLSSDIGIGGAMEFEANSAVNEVAATGPGAGVEFVSADNQAFFEPGDNLVLTGIWITIPYGFSFGTGRTILEIAWKGEGGLLRDIPELSNSSLVTMPNFCDLEIPKGLFIRTPADQGLQELVLTGFTGNISMVNLPSVLNELTIKIQVHLRLTHTKPLTSLG